MNLRAQLNDLARWAGIVGWFSIIGGAISALIGLFAYIVGAIPGIITVILGIKLINARTHALNTSLTIEQNVDSNMINMVRELALYFKIQGIIQIIGIAFAIIALFFALIVALVAGISLTNYMNI